MGKRGIEEDGVWANIGMKMYHNSDGYPPLKEPIEKINENQTDLLVQATYYYQQLTSFCNNLILK